MNEKIIVHSNRNNLQRMQRTETPARRRAVVQGSGNKSYKGTGSKTK